MKMEFDQLSKRVIGCAIEVHRELGVSFPCSCVGMQAWLEDISVRVSTMGGGSE